MIKKTIKKILNSLGYNLVKVDNQIEFDNFYSNYSQVNNEIVDIEKLGKMSMKIPGMITPAAGKFLFFIIFHTRNEML